MTASPQTRRKEKNPFFSSSVGPCHSAQSCGLITNPIIVPFTPVHTGSTGAGLWEHSDPTDREL